MYAEAQNPDVALDFLAAMWAQTENTYVKSELETRMKELIIERDIRHLEAAVTHYRDRNGVFPKHMRELARAGEVVGYRKNRLGENTFWMRLPDTYIAAPIRNDYASSAPKKRSSRLLSMGGPNDTQ